MKKSALAERQSQVRHSPTAVNPERQHEPYAQYLHPPMIVLRLRAQQQFCHLPHRLQTCLTTRCGRRLSPFNISQVYDRALPFLLSGFATGIPAPVFVNTPRLRQQIVDQGVS